MFGNRLEIEFTLVSETPLHVGTGAFEEMSREGSNEATQYMAVTRDGQECPYIPGSTLKGALLAIAEAVAPASFKALFGTAGDKKPKEAAAMGRLLFFGSSAEPSVKNETLPYAKRLNKSNGYIAARTAIDGKSGVADDHRLFFQEMIEPGTRFPVRAVLLAESDGAFAREARALLSILARDGLQLGKSKADGEGRLHVEQGKITLRSLVIGEDGSLMGAGEEDITAADSGQQSGINRFELVCETPFLVADSSTDPEYDPSDPDRDRKNSGPQIRAQRTDKTHPLMHGSTISGALRARATWLCRRDRIRSGKSADREMVPEAVLQLFGTPDQMALLHIRDYSVSKAEPWEITSVKIDHFSGAPVDNALFRTAGFLGTKLTFHLRLISRPGNAPGSDAENLFRLLCEDIRCNGLMLGAGNNKGFGWFASVGGDV